MKLIVKKLKTRFKYQGMQIWITDNSNT